MSNAQQPTDDNSERGSQSSVDTARSRTEPPPFQAFPAAAREARPRPNSRSQAALGNPVTPEVARSGIHQQGPQDDASLHSSGHGADASDLAHRERQRAATLPAFTPFPSAAPGSRWAPPEGARPEPARPVPPPAFEPESMHVGGQPSPYAPPGPLTARPHVCEHCETGFARAHDLRRHLETHRSERPHKCPNCGRSFSRKDAVQRHLVLTQCSDPTPGSSSSH